MTIILSNFEQVEDIFSEDGVNSELVKIYPHLFVFLNGFIKSKNMEDIL